MRKNKSIEFQIVSTDGTNVSLKDALSPVAINETEFPEWANDILDEGCICIVFTADPALYRRGGYLMPLPQPKCSNAQMVVVHTAWIVLNAIRDTYPNAFEQEITEWMKFHTLNSINLVADKDILKVYTRISEN